MIVPPFLRKGDSIGVTAPSYSASEESDGIRFRSAVDNLGKRGYTVHMTQDVFGYGEEEDRAPAEMRAQELMSLFEGDDRIIVSAKGGDYAYEILDLLDWDLMERIPKWIQGYSDNTSLLLKYTVEHDVATVYCGNFGDFGMGIWHRSIEDDMSFLEGNLKQQRSFGYHETHFHDRITQLEGISDDERTVWHCDGNKSFEGRLIGGCMDILDWFSQGDSLDIGSFLDRYPDDSIVWYMETFAMDDASVRRMFSRMDREGWFERVSGFVFGREMFFEGDDYAGTVRDCLSSYDVPIVFGADVGHKAPRMVFVNGLMSRFDIEGGACTLTYL